MEEVVGRAGLQESCFLSGTEKIREREREREDAS